MCFLMSGQGFSATKFFPRLAIAVKPFAGVDLESNGTPSQTITFLK
jgi:hypothetical protein